MQKIVQKSNKPVKNVANLEKMPQTNLKSDKLVYKKIQTSKKKVTN